MRILSIAALLALFGRCDTLLAGEYIVEISGAEGTAFGGTCLSIVANKTGSNSASGTVPHTLEFSADAVSCAIQKKGGSGELRIVIRGADGHIVAQSSEVQPFGVVMAAGR